jgi:hypothetical protein
VLAFYGRARSCKIWPGKGHKSHFDIGQSVLASGVYKYTRGETRNRPICVVKQPLCNVSVHTSKRVQRIVQLQFCFKTERERQRVALLLRRLHLPLHKNVMSTLKILNGMKYTRGRRSRHINSGYTYIVCFTRVYSGRGGFAPARCAASAFYINISAAPD